jgi:aryl-alcohol dehydrogenase-like predicted oxidoreductase
MQKISGLATAQGTHEHLQICKLPKRVSMRKHFSDLTLSTLGWGTQSGEPKNIVDLKYETALPRILEAGINVIDTSPSYRHQRSQRALGTALSKFFHTGKLSREALLLTTHAGFLAFDRKEADPEVYLQDRIFPTTKLCVHDFVGHAWSMHPTWIRYQLDLSSRLMQVESFDILYLDAPDIGLRQSNKQAWESQLADAFREMEELKAEGKIAAWGVASLEGFRDKGDGHSLLDIDHLMALAKKTCGQDHGFRALQLPYNLGMLDLLNVKTQAGAPLLEAIQKHGLHCSGMLSLGQGQLCEGLPEDLRNNLGQWPEHAQTALEFARSTPGMHCALVGMKSKGHLEQNLELQKQSPLEEDLWRSLFAD